MLQRAAAAEAEATAFLRAELGRTDLPRAERLRIIEQLRDQAERQLPWRQRLARFFSSSTFLRGAAAVAGAAVLLLLYQRNQELYRSVLEAERMKIEAEATVPFLTQLGDIAIPAIGLAGLLTIASACTGLTWAAAPACIASTLASASYLRRGGADARLGGSAREADDDDNLEPTDAQVIEAQRARMVQHRAALARSRATAKSAAPEGPPPVRLPECLQQLDEIDREPWTAADRASVVTLYLVNTRRVREAAVAHARGAASAGDLATALQPNVGHCYRRAGLATFFRTNDQVVYKHSEPGAPHKLDRSTRYYALPNPPVRITRQSAETLMNRDAGRTFLLVPVGAEFVGTAHENLVGREHGTEPVLVYGAFEHDPSRLADPTWRLDWHRLVAPFLASLALEAERQLANARLKAAHHAYHRAEKDRDRAEQRGGGPNARLRAAEAARLAAEDRARHAAVDTASAAATARFSVDRFAELLGETYVRRNEPSLAAEPDEAIAAVARITGALLVARTPNWPLELERVATDMSRLAVDAVELIDKALEAHCAPELRRVRAENAELRLALAGRRESPGR